MNRRTFLETSAAAGLAYSSIATTAAEIAKGPVKRVALIGSGWYGKIDLFRLIQVAPVEVVAALLRPPLNSIAGVEPDGFESDISVDKDSGGMTALQIADSSRSSVSRASSSISTLGGTKTRNLES